jgi:hypothetical protein
MWARIAEAARKRPNRGNRGHEFGWENFTQFCKVSAQMGVPPVKRLIRGHDHVALRWQFYPEYSENPVLTINAMGRRMEAEPEPVDGPHPFPVMGRHVPNQLPVVVRLPLEPQEVNKAFEREKPKQAEGTTSPEGQPQGQPPAGSSDRSLENTTGEMSHSRAAAHSESSPGIEEMEDLPGGVRIDPLHNLLPKSPTDPETGGGQ